ncbi:oxidoreductase [Catenulispora rubra]|uniref:oxidoreductase n=1 Tax=Catenulispora rubra TaxID=280293 RepID=UPI0018922B1F|nr:oxidoreductase [Catenulispora rubra]
MDTRSPIRRLAAVPNAAEAAETAREAVDRVRRHKVLRSQSARVTAESQLRGARASAALGSLTEPGTDWPLEEVRRRTDLGDEDGSGLLRGALRISGELGTLAPVWKRSPIQALSRMHLLAAAGHLDQDKVGRPRDPEAAATLNTLANELRDPATADVPAVVVAAAVHAELLVHEPFGWADGLLARAASRLILADRGLDPQSLAVVEAGHVDLGTETYLAAARAYATGTDEALATWLAQYAEAVALGARESLAVCEAIMRG